MRNVNSIMNKIVFIGMSSWPILGFKRGMESYDYNFSKDKLYKKKYSKVNESPLCIHKAGWGLVGTVFYLTPIFCLIAVYKELYRLEVNLRGIEDEKKTDWYNELF